MGLIATVLAFTRRTRRGVPVPDVKADPGGGANVTAEHYGPAGDDAQPLQNDFTHLSLAPGSGRRTITGYLDPNNAGKAGPGEKRIYSRNSGADVVAQSWLKSDGTIETSNDEASAVIAADGTVEHKNSSGSATISPDGQIEHLNGGGSMTIAADGTITITNGAGVIHMQPGGIVSINGATIDTTGLITSPAGIVAPSAVIGGVEVADHNHVQGDDSDGDSQQPTGPMQ